MDEANGSLISIAIIFQSVSPTKIQNRNYSNTMITGRCCTNKDSKTQVARCMHIQHYNKTTKREGV